MRTYNLDPEIMPASCAAVVNQKNSGSFNACYNPIKFETLNPDAGPGAILMMIHDNPGLPARKIVDLLHAKYHTTGFYSEAFTNLRCAKVIETSRKTGCRLTDLGLAVLREHDLI